MTNFIYFPEPNNSFDDDMCFIWHNETYSTNHFVLFETGNKDAAITSDIDDICFIWLKMRGLYYPIDKTHETNNNIDALQYFRHHINGYRKYRSKYWEFIQDKKANSEDWEAEQLAFKTWEFPDLETENVEARLPRDYEEPRNLIYATFEEPHVFYIFNPPDSLRSPKED